MEPNGVFSTIILEKFATVYKIIYNKYVQNLAHQVINLYHKIVVSIITS